jgi:hypothetical protein
MTMDKMTEKELLNKAYEPARQIFVRPKNGKNRTEPGEMVDGPGFLTKIVDR